MNDGTYDLMFRADGFEARCAFTVRGQEVAGHDGQFEFTGRVVETRNKLTASLRIHLKPGAVNNTNLPDRFSLTMSGSADEREFSLIGTGPLGIIVDFAGRWIGP